MDNEKDNEMANGNTDPQPTHCADCGRSMREDECACLAEEQLDPEEGTL